MNAPKNAGEWYEQQAAEARRLRTQLRLLEREKDQLGGEMLHIELCIKDTKRALERAENTGD